MNDSVFVVNVDESQYGLVFGIQCLSVHFSIEPENIKCQEPIEIHYFAAQPTFESFALHL